MVIFDTRRYDGAYMSCVYVPRAMKFIAFIDESIEESKSTWQKKKRLLSVLVLDKYHPNLSSEECNFVQFRILSMLYI